MKSFIPLILFIPFMVLADISPEKLADIREKALELAIDFHKGKNPSTSQLLNTARDFEDFLLNKKVAYKNKENNENKVNKVNEVNEENKENLQDDEISLTDTKTYKKKNKSKKKSNFEGYSLGINLEGYYITAKGGDSKTFNTGVTNFFSSGGEIRNLQNEDLGTGNAFGFSVGKHLTDSFRLELEAIKRTGYDFEASFIEFPTSIDKAKIQTEALFINGFYDFQPLTISNTAITPYLGGGMGISRNKMETSLGVVVIDGVRLPAFDYSGRTPIQFAHKLSVGTLVSLTEQLSLDVNYQYVNLGEFKGGTQAFHVGEFLGADSGKNRSKGLNDGVIKTQELMVGLQYKF